MQEKRFSIVSDVEEREAVADLVESSRQKLAYVQDQISDLQASIVDIDGNKVA